jgi:hypothetical protein
MSNDLQSLLEEVPSRPNYNPTQTAIAEATGSGLTSVVNVLKQFASMPPSTGIIANPVRYKGALDCSGASVLTDVRSFTIRGILFEEDIVTGAADTIRVIFAGLFGRLPRSPEEAGLLGDLIHESFYSILQNRYAIRDLAGLMKASPAVPPELAIQHRSCLRKSRDMRPAYAAGINTRRTSADILKEMIQVHMENVAVGACSGWIRTILKKQPNISETDLQAQTSTFLKKLQDSGADPFSASFSLLLGRSTTEEEARILGRMGTIQVHHGSAGSNMVARYLGTLHTKSVSDLFTASQMALDSARHFGAITDMSEFVEILLPMSPASRDQSIRQRILQGNLPTFGHPEIAAAGRANRVEMDPRPALYLAPLFRAIDSGAVRITPQCRERLQIAQRIYQLALVEGVEKPGKEGAGTLRLAPNTDFGAWCVQESLAIAEPDRTLMSYAYRGFGWMMDVREQLQDKIIRPVIPPDPSIIPGQATDTTITDMIASVHQRLAGGFAFDGAHKSS